MVNDRETIIKDLHDEMLTRDSLSNALALAKASEIELLLERNRVMQYRLDLMAAAAPLHPVQ
eukprot:2113077-Heterocapsa_arctica.AAC.1